MNNRNRQILRAMRMMYGQQGFRPRTPSEICIALSDFAEALSAGLMSIADSIKKIQIPTVQNVTFTWAYDETTKEESHMKHCPCEVCNNGVEGYTDCKLHLEGECREGGGFEGFEPREVSYPPEYTGFMPESTGKQVIIMVCWAFWFFAMGVLFYKWLLPLIESWF